MSDRPTAPQRGTNGTRLISRLTQWMGSPQAITLATVLTVAWIVGLLFVPGGLYNQTYQFSLDTVASIVTFLMVFIIQSAQNRDSRAIQAKLDAHTRALYEIGVRLEVAHTEGLIKMMALEEAPEPQIQQVHHQVRNGHEPNP